MADEKVADISTEKRIRTLAKTMQIIANRTALGSGLGRMGKSYFPESGGGAERDVYKALGYSKILQFDDYLSMFKRSEIGKRVVGAMPNACWRKVPSVYEADNDGEPTQFDEAWANLVKQLRVFHYLARADRLAGVGWFGVLLLGFSDVKNVAEMQREVQTSDNLQLLYLRPYMMGATSVEKWVEDPNDPRYGLPETYKIKVRSVKSKETSKTKKGQDSGQDFTVHHSRVIHIAEELTDNDVWGTPRMECVFNHLQSLEYVVGGSAEMFWRGAFPGYSLAAKEGYSFDAQSLDDLEDEMQAFLHDMQRYARLEGIDMKAIEQEVASPKDHFDVLISIISAGTEIPKRILLGSERGELASTQDENSWLDRVSNRRVNFCEPTILRPFVDRLCKYRVLPEVKSENGYVVDWPDLMTRSEKEQAEVAKAVAEALSKYATSPGASSLVPPSVFLSDVLGMDQEVINRIEEIQGSLDEGLEEED